MYVSYVPGRVRIRTDDPDVLAQIAALAQEMPGIIAPPVRGLRVLAGIIEATVNHRTGSLLVLFEEHLMDRETLESLMKAYLPKEAGGRNPSPSISNMAIAKRGMLSSLGLALVFALLDREDGHVFSGAMFLGFLGYHLYGYRKRLLA